MTSGQEQMLHHFYASAGANIGVILISSVAWGSCLFEYDTLRTVRPAQVLFPAYQEDTLTKVWLYHLS